MPTPTNFTLFSFFFQFLQVFRQLVYVGVGEGVGFGKGGYEVAGAAAEKAAPQTAAFGGQVRGPGQDGGVEIAPPLLFAGDASLFLQPGQRGAGRAAPFPARRRSAARRHPTGRS